MRSHFRMTSGAAMACAAAGAVTMLNGHCAAQPYLAADYATNSIYAGGWAEGQNGGYGFGPWSFYGTDPAGAPFQSLSTASALGTAWTMFTTNQANGGQIGGLANAGRAILEPGGLQVGQTIETFIVNPLNTHFYRGWTIAFCNNTNNTVGGDNSNQQMSVYHFEYFNYGQWTLSDLQAAQLGQPISTTLNATDTNPGGLKIDLTLTATNAYHVVLTPLNNPANVYVHDGLTKTNGSINWIMFQNYDTTSTGTNDISDNFEISSMTVFGTALNIQPAGPNVILSWSTNVPNFVLASSPSLGASAVWTTNLPVPVVVGDQNFVTNPISGLQQFYRLQLAQ